MSTWDAGELSLHAAHQMVVEDDRVQIAVRRGGVSRTEVMAEICLQLAPFKADEDQELAGSTVISKDLTIDSLAVMDMVMELEDRFDVSIPMNVVAEIQTVDQLANTIVALSARR